MTQIAQQIKSELATICAITPETVSEDALLIQYGLDSVRSLELIVSLEAQFRIEISDSELARIRKVRDVVELIERKVA